MDRRHNTHGRQYSHRHWSQRSAGYYHQRNQRDQPNYNNMDMSTSNVALRGSGGNQYGCQRSAGYCHQRNLREQHNDNNRDMSTSNISLGGCLKSV